MAEADFTAGNQIVLGEVDQDSPGDETLFLKLKERDNEAIEAPPPLLSVGTGELKTATGVATSAANFNISITMNDYSFFPSITVDPSATASIIAQPLADPVNTIGRFFVLAGGVGVVTTARWRYMTASDNPTVWVSFDVLGNILATWMSDDPTPDGSPGVVAYDATGKIALKALMVPRGDLSKLLTGIPIEKIELGRKKSTTQDKEPFSIMWEAFKNPADEIIKRAKIIGGKLEAR